MKIISKWIFNICLIVLIIIVALLGVSMLNTRNNPDQIPSVLGYSPMSVLSGSMSPMIEPGDMIIIKKPKIDQIEIGNVVTYRVGVNTFVTHRVIDILSENGQIKLQTQGDANNTADQTLIELDDLVGNYVFNIPNGGYIAKFIRSPIGLILSILLPIALIIGSELYTIVSKEKKQRNQSF